jgi:hypothetical protein
VKKHILLALLVCEGVWAGPSASEQPPAGCKPKVLKIPGARYRCIYTDNRVTFPVVAPDAQKVRIRLGQGFDMSKEADGLWYVTTTPQVVGFHYYTLSIDGAVVADPATRTFFGSGFYNSAIEIPRARGGRKSRGTKASLRSSSCTSRDAPTSARGRDGWRTR